MSRSPRYEQTEARKESEPEQAAPFPEVPPTIAKCPPRDADVHNIGDEEWCEKRSDDLLL